MWGVALMPSAMPPVATFFLRPVPLPPTLGPELELLQDYKEQMVKKARESQKVPGKKGSKKWLWITGGTAIAGGVAAAVLLGGGDEKKATEFPGPPGRP